MIARDQWALWSDKLALANTMCNTGLRLGVFISVGTLTMSNEGNNVYTAVTYKIYIILKSLQLSLIFRHVHSLLRSTDLSVRRTLQWQRPPNWFACVYNRVAAWALYFTWRLMMLMHPGVEPLMCNPADYRDRAVSLRTDHRALDNTLQLLHRWPVYAWASVYERHADSETERKTWKETGGRL